MDLPVQPIQFGRCRPGSRLRSMYEPLEFVNILQSQPAGPDAGDVVAVVEQLQDPHLHDPQRREVERRPAVQRCGRRLHVQRDEDRQGDRPQRALERRRRAAHECRRQGHDQVVLTFNAPSQPYFYYVADQTPIVPSTSGPTLNQSKLSHLRRLAPRRHRPVRGLELLAAEHQVPANPSYWQSTPGHPVPQIKEVDYPAFLSNTPANLFLAQGQAQWGGQYIPNVQASTSPRIRRTGTSGSRRSSTWRLVPNLTNPLLSQLPVRQAIAYALNSPRSRGSARAASSSPPTRRASSRRPSRAGSTAR